MKAPAIALLAAAGGASSLVFVPNLAVAVGATEGQVGVIFAVHSLLAFLASFAFGRIADVRGRRRVLQFGLGLSVAAAVTQVFAFDPWTIGLSRAFLGLAVGVYPGALVAFAYEAEHKMGRFAMYGSLGWAAGNFLAGVLAFAYPGQFALVFAGSSALFCAAWLVAMSLKVLPERLVDVPRFPLAVIRRNLPIYVTMLVRHTGANMVWVIFPLFLERVRGFTLFDVGLLLAVNPLIQAAVMFQLDPYPGKRLVPIGIVLSAVTFLLFTLATDFFSMLLTQVVLGTAWATLWVGSLKMVTERNEERATATGLLASTTTLASILGPLAGGFIALTYGYFAAMYAAAAMSALALVTYLWASGAEWGAIPRGRGSTFK